MRILFPVIVLVIGPLLLKFSLQILYFIVAVILLAGKFASIDIVHVAIRRDKALSFSVPDLSVLKTLSRTSSIFSSRIWTYGADHLCSIEIYTHLTHFFLLDVLAFLNEFKSFLAVKFELYVDLIANSTTVVHLKQFFLLVEVSRMQFVIFLSFVSFLFLFYRRANGIAQDGHLNIGTNSLIPLDRIFLDQ